MKGSLPRFFALGVLILGFSFRFLSAQEVPQENVQLPDTREPEPRKPELQEPELAKPETGRAAAGFRDRFSWAFHGSLLIFPEENGQNRGAPAPILPSPGASLAYRIWGPFSAESSLDLYFTHYGYDFELDRPIPAEVENRSAFVFGPVLGLSLGGRVPAGERFGLRLSGGIALDLRIVTLAFDLNEADLAEDDPWGAPMQAEAVRDYFWDQGRWLLPVLGAGFDVALNERFILGLDFRVWFPLYRLWTGEDLPDLEGWRFGPGFRVTVR